MQIEKIPVSRLNPAAYNPRKELKSGDKDYEKLKRSISEFGIVEPIVINRQTGNIVGGHQRFTVLKDLGYTEIECVVVDLDLPHEKALNVALNRIQGEWDVVCILICSEGRLVYGRDLSADSVVYLGRQFRRDCPLVDRWDYSADHYRLRI